MNIIVSNSNTTHKITGSLKYSEVSFPTALSEADDRHRFNRKRTTMSSENLA